MKKFIEVVKAEGGLLAICFLDLDGFKQVNNQLGHKAGDAVLVNIANRLRAAIRAEDSVLRLGGDEFVLILGGLLTKNQVELLLARLIQAVREPIFVGEEFATVGASIGVSLFPFDNVSISALLSHADQAVYQAKNFGKNCWRFYETTGQLEMHLKESLKCN